MVAQERTQFPSNGNQLQLYQYKMHKITVKAEASSVEHHQPVPAAPADREELIREPSDNCL